ncbi:hypothetical protein GCM10012275_35480 [Longimycelium tulufanense]|uniref:Uncharacterized protein n=1 Tax=Longimycelium tulufanense TaxID=907463 RepID=A0A8J3FVW7_9PSEU|nr:hypothetical protein GCM10012275_35480 [Longimycelium tulufanense]
MDQWATGRRPPAGAPGTPHRIGSKLPAPGPTPGLARLSVTARFGGEKLGRTQEFLSRPVTPLLGGFEEHHDDLGVLRLTLCPWIARRFRTNKETRGQPPDRGSRL